MLRFKAVNSPLLEACRLGVQLAAVGGDLLRHDLATIEFLPIIWHISDAVRAGRNWQVAAIFAIILAIRTRFLWQSVTTCNNNLWRGGIRLHQAAGTESPNRLMLCNSQHNDV